MKIAKRIASVFLVMSILMSIFAVAGISASAAVGDITFNSLSFPASITLGKSQSLNGTVMSSGGYNLTKVEAIVKNAKTGKVYYDKTVKPGVPVYSLKGSALDKAISFGTLAEGNYTIKFVAANSYGKTSVSKEMSFIVINVKYKAQSFTRISSSTLSKYEAKLHALVDKTNGKKASEIFGSGKPLSNRNWSGGAWCAEYATAMSRKALSDAGYSTSYVELTTSTGSIAGFYSNMSRIISYASWSTQYKYKDKYYSGTSVAGNTKTDFLKKVKIGDFALMETGDGDKYLDHTGIIIDVSTDGKTLLIAEGNTGGGGNDKSIVKTVKYYYDATKGMYKNDYNYIAVIAYPNYPTN